MKGWAKLPLDHVDLYHLGIRFVGFLTVIFLLVFVQRLKDRRVPSVKSRFGCTACVDRSATDRIYPGSLACPRWLPSIALPRSPPPRRFPYNRSLLHRLDPSATPAKKKRKQTWSSPDPRPPLSPGVLVMGIAHRALSLAAASGPGLVSSFLSAVAFCSRGAWIDRFSC
jgi:hypothetical protein